MKLIAIFPIVIPCSPLQLSHSAPTVEAGSASGITSSQARQRQQKERGERALAAGAEAQEQAH